MTAENFCYWLQGFFELRQRHGGEGESDGKIGGDEYDRLSFGQVECIRRHLALVFVHDIDPKAGGPEVQAKLNAAHAGALPVYAPGIHYDPQTGKYSGVKEDGTPMTVDEVQAAVGRLRPPVRPGHEHIVARC